jgi:hypothetical protein
VKRWRDAGMALRWTAAAMLEAAKGFRELRGNLGDGVIRRRAAVAR